MRVKGASLSPFGFDSNFDRNDDVDGGDVTDARERTETGSLVLLLTGEAFVVPLLVLLKSAFLASKLALYLRSFLGSVDEFPFLVSVPFALPASNFALSAPMLCVDRIMVAYVASRGRE